MRPPPEHQTRLWVIANAVVVTAVVAVVAVVAVSAGAGPDANDPAPAASLVAPAGSSSSPPPAVPPSSEPTATTPPAIDLSAVRALPPAGSGDDGSPATEGAEPVDLRIPSLDVDDAPVVAVGIDPAGGLEIPGAHEVGWYRFGARPGVGAGSVVLAAHVAYDGEDGVFRHLGGVEPGATVEVETADGRPLSYRVDSVVVYRKADLPIDDLFSPSTPERLVLISCGGSFNPQLRHYDSNIVAIATPTH